MTAATCRPRERHAEAVSLDKGCQYAPKCVVCPWPVCVKELPTAEHATFTAVLRAVRGYLPAPDRALK